MIVAKFGMHLVLNGKYIMAAHIPKNKLAALQIALFIFKGFVLGKQPAIKMAERGISKIDISIRFSFMWQC